MYEASILELRQALDEGQTTCVELCEHYLARIATFNPALSAVAEINPQWRAVAAQMDLELKLNGPRSLLHGIPVAVKDNIDTEGGMHTTAGSLALSDLYASSDAFLVKKLKQAGAIVLAKANLSEFAYFMSTESMPSGYSSRGGQVKNPYGDLDPLGSSTGSAVMVAADLIPVAVGSETNGSLIAPATNNSLVSIKPTLGLISRSGMIPITPTQDTAGPLARSVKDAAALLDQLWGRDEHDPQTLTNPYLDYRFLEACGRDVSGLKLGVVTFEGGTYEPAELSLLQEAAEIYRRLGCEVVDVTLSAEPIQNYVTLLYEFKGAINHYLASKNGLTAMRSLSDIIAYNDAHPETCLKYGQSILTKADSLSGTLIESEYLTARAKIDKQANQINVLFEEQDLDGLILPHRTSHAPIAGNPCITVPAKSLLDLVPGNLVLIGRKWDDETLFALANAYEEQTKRRVPPRGYEDEPTKGRDE
jgi:amidase